MKKWTLRITICLILGVVTNIGVAWLLGYFSLHLDTGLPLRSVVEYRGQSIEIDVYGTAGIKEVLFGLDNSIYEPDVVQIGWVQRLVEDEPPVPDGDMPLPTARGFPFISMACFVSGYWNGSTHTYDVRYGYLLQPTDQWAYRVIPLRPVFPGFLINTLFYAAIWFGLFFAMGRTRRVIRTRRGRCPRCGYDLQNNLADGCSECGWGRGE